MPNTERLFIEVRRAARPLTLLLLMFGLAIATIVVVSKNLTFQRPWQSYRTVKVQFDDVKGIFPGGHQVRINGVKVGIVQKSDLVKGRPVLTLKLEKKWGPVYKNAKMRIRPVTPLQDLYVNITDRGTKDAGEAGENDLIASSQTVTPVDVSRVLNTFNASTRDRMTILLSEMSKSLDDGGAKLRATFAELAPFLHVAEDTTRVIADRQAAVKRIISNFGKLSAALAKRDSDLNKFVVQGNSALGKLAENDQPLSATLQNLGDLVPVMRDSFATIEGLSGDLDPALRSLQPVAADLKTGLAALQKFGKEATPALTALRPATRDLRVMARQLPATSNSLSTAFTRLRGQAPQFDRITQTVDPCMDTIRRFMEQTISVVKFTGPGGSFPRADQIVDTDVISDGGTSGALNSQIIPTCVK
ncbi:hypothetical protein DSM112329_00888 [Paraconexibacter sp. AEG42_29]|uniref:Mce/MlaD domain-containing protein n=1 Tax=Paraconexibacter sp. AEG42_29 TaxID=2997339 RepID=A0AAU7AQZ1_9ACTN